MQTRKDMAKIAGYVLDGESRPAGTFFTVSIPRMQDNTVAYDSFFVTAQHVVNGALHSSSTSSLRMRLNLAQGGTVDFDISEDEWQLPTDLAVDLAVARWPGDGRLPASDQLDFATLIFNGLNLAVRSKVERLEIAPGDEVVFPGLFSEHPGADERILPIVRTGNIAALEAGEVSTPLGLQRVHLIEARSLGGLSGSPVFVNIGASRFVNYELVHSRGDRPSVLLLGVVSGHWDRNDMVHMGIGFVTPVDDLVALLDREQTEAGEQPIDLSGEP